MTASALRLSEPASPPWVDRDTLAFLRVHWARTRCLARSDLFTLPAQSSETLDGSAIALLRALSSADALGRLQFYQLGTPEQSFDEKWLLAALKAGASDDTDSLMFLLNSRLEAPARRRIGALVMALSRRLHAPRKLV